LQLVSGKTGDHKKKFETDKAKELLDLSKPAKQKAFTLSAPSAMWVAGALFSFLTPIF
jgi:hypothetical protein